MALQQQQMGDLLRYQCVNRAEQKLKSPTSCVSGTFISRFLLFLLTHLHICGVPSLRDI